MQRNNIVLAIQYESAYTQLALRLTLDAIAFEAALNSIFNPQELNVIVPTDDFRYPTLAASFLSRRADGQLLLGMSFLIIGDEYTVSIHTLIADRDLLDNMIDFAFSVEFI